MKLPNLPKGLSFKEKTPPSNYYLTLTIGMEKVDAVVFEETLKHIKVVGHTKEFLDKDINSIDDDTLLNILDKTISSAEKSLPTNIETQNTIFGVDHSWVENGKIKKDQLLKLKKISDELELKPIGFIVTNEAISHILQKEEGAPISAILTQIGKKYLTATLLRGGRIIESKTGEIQGSTPETLDAILKHFSTPEVLPSRIIIYGENNEEINQAFTGFSWSKNLPFLHLPQINPLENYLDAKAVLYGAASQMNFVATDISLLGTLDNISDISDIAEEKPMTKLENSKSEIIKDNQKSDDFFGFVEGTDVSKDTEEIDQTKLDNQTNIKNIPNQIEEIPEDLQIKNSETKSFSTNALLIFSGIKPTLSKLARGIKLPTNLISFLTGKGKLFIIPIALIILLLSFILYFFIFRSAKIAISIVPKETQNNQSVIFGEDLSTDATKGTIKAKYISVSEDGKLTKDTTGKKQTGNNAKGTITIFNLNQNPKTYSAGTTVSSSNSLKFTLDNSVTVATGSSDPTNPSAGTAKVNVTASSFGTQYNLPSGTKFSIGTDPLVAAKNDDSFSGGTTKDITIVSADDINKLTSDIIKNLQDRAKQDIKNKISSDEILLPEFVDTSFDLKNFNKKAGEEASNVSLTATVVFRYIVYSKTDLEKFAQSLSDQQDGEDFLVNKDNINASAENIKIDKNNHTSAKLTITTSLIPNINTDSIANSVAGKSINDSESIISKIPQVTNVSISISPNPLFLPKVLPSSPKKIKITIITNG